MTWIGIGMTNADTNPTNPVNIKPAKHRQVVMEVVTDIKRAIKLATAIRSVAIQMAIKPMPMSRAKTIAIRVKRRGGQRRGGRGRKTGIIR
jgi:hypothetical protein